MEDLVRQILAVTQEEDREDGNHEESREDRGSKPGGPLNRAVDHGAMLLQECSDTIRLRLGPAEIVSEIVRDLSGRNPVCQRRERSQEPGTVPLNLWRKGIREEDNHRKKSQVSFDNVRSTQILEEQGMALKKSDDRVNQVGEQNRKCENDNHVAGNIDNREHNCESKGSSQNSCRPRVKHRSRPPR